MSKATLTMDVCKIPQYFLDMRDELAQYTECGKCNRTFDTGKGIYKVPAEFRFTVGSMMGHITHKCVICYDCMNELKLI